MTNEQLFRIFKHSLAYLVEGSANEMWGQKIKRTIQDAGVKYIKKQNMFPPQNKWR